MYLKLYLGTYYSSLRSVSVQRLIIAPGYAREWHFRHELSLLYQLTKSHINASAVSSVMSLCEYKLLVIKISHRNVFVVSSCMLCMNVNNSS